MSTEAFAGVGAELWRRPGPDSGEWTKVAEVNSINGPTAGKEFYDATSLDSTGGYREFIPGFIDPGELTFDCNMTHDNYETLKSDFEANTNRTFKVALANDENSILEFQGIVTQIPLNIPMDDKVTISVTVKISGSITLYKGSTTTTTT